MSHSEGKQPEFHVDILLYRDGNGWAAHCLQLDLVECGATPEEAEDALAGVIQHHVQWALEDDDMEHLFHPAPAEVWKRFFTAEPKGFREIPITLPVDRIAAPPTVTVYRATAQAAA